MNEGEEFEDGGRIEFKIDFEDVDYIKIDVEGHELKVLQGGVDTINRCKPIIVLEQESIVEIYGKGSRYDAMNYLLDSLGYELVAYDGWTDYVFKYRQS